MRPIMFSLLIVAWVVAFLLSMLSVWIIVAVHNRIGLPWTAAIMATISTVSLIFKLFDRAGGVNE
jgi:hypothetical protein